MENDKDKSNVSDVDIRQNQLRNIDNFESKLASLISESIDADEDNDVYDRLDQLKRDFLEDLLDTFKDSGIEHVSSYYENYIYGILHDRVERAYSKFRAINRISRTIDKCNDQLGSRVITASFEDENSIMDVIDSLFFIEKMCALWGVPHHANEICRRWMDKNIK